MLSLESSCTCWNKALASTYDIPLNNYGPEQILSTVFKTLVHVADEHAGGAVLVDIIVA